MDFKDLCQFFEQIKETKTANDKKKLIRERFKQIRNENGSNSSFDFFQILRLFLPSFDRERTSFNMKEAKMSRILTKLLDLSPGHDRNVLSKSHLMAGQASDFGDVVYSVIRKYLRSYNEKVTIDDVNKFLDDITKRKTEHEAEQAMMQMFQKIPAENIRWVIRIILKDLRLGISPNSILNCYHTDGAAYYATNNSLKKVCDILADENVKLHELEIEIFEPFRPMLSKRIDGSNFKKEFVENKLFFVEEKFDGERFQLHLKDGNFMYFSRNGFNYTDNLGKNYNTGTFTPKLRGLLEPTVNKLILDGELMLWDSEYKNFGCKGMALDVKKLNVTGRYQPCFCVFDIIMLNDRILTNQPLKERKQILKTVFQDVKDGVILRSKVKAVSSRQEILDELNAIGKREDEGIVVKDPDSIYKYSDRNSGWYKMKLEYFQAVIKLAKGRIELEEILKTSSRKVAKPKLVMPTIFDVRQVCDILEGFTVYLLNGTEEMSKEQAESFVQKVGGNTSFRLVDTVDIVLVGIKTEKVGKIIARRANYDIVDLKWLQRVLEHGDLVPYRQGEVYYIAPNYKNILADGLDMYGDSYTEGTTVEGLKRTFEIIEHMGDFCNVNDTIRYTGSLNCIDYNAYFDKYEIPNDKNSKLIYDSLIDEIEFRFYNGYVCDTICEEVNLLVYSGEEGRRKFLEEYLNNINRTDIELRCNSFLYK
ncbi:unnamed protein product [Acanthoscelides obtectus]|uniref:DNA ligase 4 n=2 Tax=Acanthoscelides obtectus TaxID=200917 RepID=A0A9P0P2G6_ACAOB|nr:unnamed protein product [Acanthoscelides obtectus]CAK1647998.1 DNA ligase 4 [Acanthoscelides obtectus]